MRVQPAIDSQVAWGWSLSARPTFIDHINSNLHPSGFDTIMPKTLATATVDRLLHHAHVVLTGGTSLRLSEGHGRTRSDALHLSHREISCPPAGRSTVRPQGSPAVR